MHTDISDRVSRQSKSPLYEQIYLLLRNKISDGQLRPGDLLPSEPELVERYQVSRATIRQALEELANDGLIQRKQGRGTFVAPPKVEQGLLRIVSFTEDMQHRGLKPGTKLIAAELIPATELLARHLEVPIHEPLARIERLRLADGEPMSLEMSYLVYRYCPGILEEDYTRFSLRKMLEDRYNLRFSNAHQTIRAINASKEIAQALSVEKDAALLYIERISCSEYKVPVEFLRLYHRGDRYTLHGELRG
ncbi:MAG: GntR family transcriptional regulator [Candidatus Promineifilaceae bacterium]|nr:GntR family transcriptional regulator [Candidatus Promineifilaceae bacterium]